MLENGRMSQHKGDRGQTSLKSSISISKADERINALGNIEELATQLNLAKTQMRDAEMPAALDAVLANLKTIADGIRYENMQQHVINESAIVELEQYIEHVDQNLLTDIDEIVTSGKNELSARLDLARALARRVERALSKMSRSFPVQANTSKYMNRLSDYLYAMARTCEKDGKLTTPIVVPATVGNTGFASEKLTMSLQVAKKVIEAVEAYAASVGKKAVIAICNAQGNPVAVHVMDDAFLVSFEVAVKKAYTAVSVKMPTIELAKLVQPGQTFYGLQNLEKIVAFGGGVPLKVGDTIVGGLGISGGTGEEDHALCEYGMRVFDSII